MKRIISNTLFLLAVTLILASCSKLEEKRIDKTEVKSPSKVFDKPSDLVADAKTRIKEITGDELKSKIAKAESFYLIDVRENDEVEAGVIEKSIHINRGILEFKITKIIPEITKDDQIVLYCKKGDRSTLAADALRSIGYKNVYALKGGYEAFMGIVSSEAPAGAPSPADDKKAKVKGGGC